MFNEEPDDENYKEARLIIKRLANEAGKRVPSFIEDGRTVREAVESAVYESETNSGSVLALRNYLGRSINEFTDYAEDKKVEVELTYIESQFPSKLTYTTIKSSLVSCEQRLEKGDYSGAVTSARTLVEGVCKEILTHFPEVEIKDNITLPQLFKKVQQNLNLAPNDETLERNLKDVLNGLIKIVNGIAEVRNKYGDAHPPKNLIMEHHAKLVVNSSKTVIDFLFKTYEYQNERGTLKKNS
nr:abortive infection family protein [Salimicrobium jeotgali]